MQHDQISKFRRINCGIVDGMSKSRLTVPIMTAGTTIPRILHQTYHSAILPDELARNVAYLKSQNPGWEHILYDDADIEQFIATEYGPEILAVFNSISPYYGAARADLFRYLLLYKRGGVYLDIKSGLVRPLDDFLLPDEQFLLSQWNTNNGRDKFGKHKEISMPGGELQQWQIIAVSGHPFLYAVLKKVLDAITSYNPWKHGTGGNGVYRVTGPVAYTLAIEPLLKKYRHRIGLDTDFGLIYLAIEGDHRQLFKGHYLMRTDPVVRQHGLSRLSAWAYDLSRRTKRLISTGSRVGKV